MTHRNSIPVIVNPSTNMTMSMSIQSIRSKIQVNHTRVEKKRVWLFIIFKKQRNNTKKHQVIRKIKGMMDSVSSTHS